MSTTDEKPRKLNDEEFEFAFDELHDYSHQELVLLLLDFIQDGEDMDKVRQAWINQYAEVCDEEANAEMDQIATEGINRLMQENSDDD